MAETITGKLFDGVARFLKVSLGSERFDLGENAEFRERVERDRKASTFEFAKRGSSRLFNALRLLKSQTTEESRPVVSRSIDERFANSGIVEAWNDEGKFDLFARLRRFVESRALIRYRQKGTATTNTEHLTRVGKTERVAPKKRVALDGRLAEYRVEKGLNARFIRVRVLDAKLHLNLKHLRVLTATSRTARSRADRRNSNNVYL